MVLPQITEFPKPEFMSKSLEELQIGTYANIAMVRTTTPVYVALGIFVQHRVSALPVVDEKGERLGRRRGKTPGKPGWLWGNPLPSQHSPEGDSVGTGSLGCQILLAELPLSP